MRDELVEALLTEAEALVGAHIEAASRIGAADELTRLQARLYFARRDEIQFRGALNLLRAVRSAVNELNAAQAEAASIRERCYESAKKTGTTEAALRRAAEMYDDWLAVRFPKAEGGGQNERNGE